MTAPIRCRLSSFFLVLPFIQCIKPAAPQPPFPFVSVLSFLLSKPSAKHRAGRPLVCCRGGGFRVRRAGSPRCSSPRCSCVPGQVNTPTKEYGLGKGCAADVKYIELCARSVRSRGCFFFRWIPAQQGCVPHRRGGVVAGLPCGCVDPGPLRRVNTGLPCELRLRRLPKTRTATRSSSKRAPCRLGLQPHCVPSSPRTQSPASATR